MIEIVDITVTTLIVGLVTGGLRVVGGHHVGGCVRRVVGYGVTGLVGSTIVTLPWVAPIYVNKLIYIIRVVLVHFS